jgi:hypothetical protein
MASQMASALSGVYIVRQVAMCRRGILKLDEFVTQRFDRSMDFVTPGRFNQNRAHVSLEIPPDALRDLRHCQAHGSTGDLISHL